MKDALGPADISRDRIASVMRDVMGTDRFADDLAELYRRGRTEIVDALERVGLNVGVANPSGSATTSAGDGFAASNRASFDAFGLTISAAGPRLDEAFAADDDVQAKLESEWQRLIAKVNEPDPFLDYYRNGVDNFLAAYTSDQGKQLDEFVKSNFAAPPKYLVTIGIGANEQFWYYMQQCHRANGGKPEWFICNNPKDLTRLPRGCTPKNTLFMEFSRSGKTQEIVKTHEFLPRTAKRVVFANTGPLAELAERDKAHCLLLPTDDRIPGRFGKNLSPMLLAPMKFLGMDVEAYWKRIGECIRAWNLTDPASPPAALARYIRAAQLSRGLNHIYFGANDELLVSSADELVQFWNEGVTKGENDVTLSRYFGLPRDSHLNIEAVLANARTKLGIFLLRKGGNDRFQHPLVRTLEPLNPAHAGLSVAEVDYILGKANADHFSTKMPVITIEMDDPTLLDSATLSQLWTDMVYCYSLMLGVNPGSNPEVKLVRDRSDALLAARRS